MKDLLERTIVLLKQLLDIRQKEMKSLLDIVKDKLGTDASPQDNAPDRLACAETISTILREYLAQHNIDFPVILGTYQLWREFQKRTDLFVRVYDTKAGTLEIAPTGTNSRPDLLPNGHVWVFLNETEACSNSSKTGTFEQNYDRVSIRKLFHYYGGYNLYLYDLKI